MTRIGVTAALLAAALLAPLAGCKAAKYDQDIAAITARYERCRSDAAGDPIALTTCSERTIAATWHEPPERELAELGDAAIAQAGGDTLAARAIAADAIARLALERTAIRAGAALPAAAEAPAASSLRAAWVRLAAGLCSDAPAGTCDTQRDRLLARLAARLGGPERTMPATTAAASASLGGYSPPTCADVRGQTPDAALADFERDFPAALRDERLVETVALDAPQLTALAGYLACLAARTGYGPDVVESSLWLFASKRQGAPAHARLEALGKGPSADAAAAREFSAQIRDYLAE